MRKTNLSTTKCLTQTAIEIEPFAYATLVRLMSDKIKQTKRHWLNLILQTRRAA
jgi:hypothetical protein